MVQISTLTESGIPGRTVQSFVASESSSSLTCPALCYPWGWLEYPIICNSVLAADSPVSVELDWLQYEPTARLQNEKENKGRHEYAESKQNKSSDSLISRSFLKQFSVICWFLPKHTQ